MHDDTSNNDKQAQEQRLQQNLARIRHRWLVLSGKGGVGKSTVAVNLACALADRGHMVGLLDTDIHGPDVLKMLGLEGHHLGGSHDQIQPVKAYLRLKIMSMASFIADPDTAVVWRGPLKMGAIRQFLADVTWGDIDHLVVDSPPGTGDEPLSTAQLIGRADGAIIVTTPQEVALLDSRKCVSFARQLGVPVAGIVENMSGMVCPHCNQPIDLFGSGGGERAARELKVPFLGAIPVDPSVVRSGDAGRPFIHFDRESPTAKAFEAIVERLLAGITEPDSKRAQGGSMRRIAIACEDDRGLDGQVSAHFGRCPCYTVVEVEGQNIVGHRVERNPHFGDHRPGMVPQFVRSLNADAILAGGMGPRAVQMFRGFGIDVVTGASGTARQVLEAYLGGTLSGIVPCQHDHPESCGAHKPGEPCVDHDASQTGAGAATTAARVVVSAADGSGVGAAMDPRFGRAPFFVVVDLASGEALEVVENRAAGDAHGAGIAAARQVGQMGAQAVIAGRFGPKAGDALRALGVELWSAPEGLSVAQVVERLRASSLARA